MRSVHFLQRLIFSLPPAFRSWLGEKGRHLVHLILDIGSASALRQVSGPATPWDPQKPLLSVVIPCFNHGRYLRRALDSLARQSFQDFEIILVDDGSDDPLTLDLLDALQEPGMTILRQPNRGPSAARNAGVERARGRYICCLDADDCLASTYLEKCLVLLEGNSGVRLAYSWVQVVGEEHRLHRSAGFHPGLLRYFNPFCVSAIFHRDDWLAVGGFDEARAAQFEDWDFWVALVGCGVRGRLIREPLLFYHRQAGSRLATGKRHALSSYRRMRTRHPRFYRGSPFLRAQRQDYYDCWTYPPLLNLSRAEQYSAAIPDAVAVVADRPLAQDWSAWRRQLDELPASTTVFVIAGGCRELPDWLLGRMSAIYWLDDLLHERQWSAFIDNFRRTRRVSKMLSVGRTTW